MTPAGLFLFPGYGDAEEIMRERRGGLGRRDPCATKLATIDWDWI